MDEKPESRNEPSREAAGGWADVMCDFCGKAFLAPSEWAWLKICDACGIPIEEGQLPRLPPRRSAA